MSSRGGSSASAWRALAGSGTVRRLRRVLPLAFVPPYRVDRAPATIRSLEWRLVRPLSEFGDVRLGDLRTGEIAAWEATLPPRFRHDVVRALRMVLDAAVRREYLPRNPAKATGKHARPSRRREGGALEPGDVDASRTSSAPRTTRRRSSGRGATCDLPSSWRSSAATTTAMSCTFGERSTASGRGTDPRTHGA